MEMLQGGRDNAIYRTGDRVSRPASSWTMTVHQLLNHLHSNGFTQCPKVIGIEGGKEWLSFVEGDTFNYPLQGSIASVTALLSAAKMLRRMHDASEDFLISHQSEVCHWMLPDRAPQEVICHGDFMPYNVALNGETVVGVFDFDTAHPAPRLWDVAFSIYGWAPFKTDENDRMGNLEQQIQRAKLFCDAYGCSKLERENLVDVMTLRLTALVDYMRLMVSSRDERFQANLEEGHHIAYLQDIDYLRQHHQAITLGILKER
ncbi:phosphotransferase enzyme family protein [Vibrio parahaemolyticus]|nr:aminoglycoside phosphotransferase family protein [Vibrio parahaemolyticus]ELA8092206.1 aminoglycoside phosphotransferase family protein [Vibrio parahaemolyticus]MBE4109130.1 aminoglycoside phosphotransferase family protein [Vibrio parahaemolyticus]MBM4797546.1 aminoglycoside phosphotransferase family protein [Vibrio parahaemolyticus]MBM4962435.1 aminoglycoside phosphotransferase family protein [Vibrio parahaemolyticus]